MHHHAGLLVHHNNCIVLVNDVERNGFWHYVTPRRGRYGDVNLVPRLCTIRRLERTVIHKDVAICNECCRLCTGKFESPRNNKIEPFTDVVVHHKLVLFFLSHRVHDRAKRQSKPLPRGPDATTQQ